MIKILKKIILLFMVFFMSFWFINIAQWKTIYESDYASININYWSSWWNSDWPEIWCKWLPGCKTSSAKWDIKVFFVWFIDLFIQIIIVLAVFALIFSWIMYIISGGEDEKTKQAKKWIIWSLVWVVLSTFSWWIIYFLNNIKF